VGTTTIDAPAEPKYWQLRTVLVRTIEDEFHPGEILPNERELSARFGVARATLRQALDQLELEGRLVRRRGIGTLIAAPRIGVPVAEPGESWRIVDGGTVKATTAVADALGLEAGAPVHTVQRVRMTAGHIVGTETLFVPPALVPHIPGFLKETSRARAVLKQFQALEIDGEQRSVELGVAEEEQARLLERPPGIPVLVLTTRYQVEGVTVAVAVSTYRADTCRLTFGDSGVEVREAS
jgi:DNA-binding GntR family transcriptional regulator